MTDYFALLEEARRPWLEAETLKEKYFARTRAAAPEAELNEAFRVLSDPKLRLQHLLLLEGAELNAGRAVPPSVAELFWNTGTLLREIDRWLLRSAEATSALARALLSGERAKLGASLEILEQQLGAIYETEVSQLRAMEKLPNDLTRLIQHYDSISYLTRLREQMREKRFRLSVAT
ncbi:MAG: hypothetical protein ACR2G0_12545 [Chthoniobacterales bacterium]